MPENHEDDGLIGRREATGLSVIALQSPSGAIPPLRGYLRMFTRKQFTSSIVILGMVAIILVLRRPDTFFNPQLWAEDGAVFLVQQREQGFIASFNPYAGYYNLVPRLIALAGDFFPLYYTPIIYNVSALIVTLLVAVFVLVNDIKIEEYRSLFPLALVLVPTAGEFYMNMSSIQWILAPAIPFIYAQPGFTTWRRSLPYSLFIVIIGLTGPFVLLSCPLLLMRGLFTRERNRYEAVFAGSAVFAALAQGVCLLRTFEESTSTGLEQASNWFQVIMGQFGAHLYFGNQLPADWPVLTTIGAAVFLSITLLALPFIENKKKRYYAFLFLSFGIIVYVSALIKYSFNPLVLHPFGRGTRYFYLPYLCLLFIYLFMAASTRPVKWVGRMGIVLMLMSSATFFTAPPLEDYHWKEHIELLDQHHEVSVPINPHWRIELREP